MKLALFDLDHTLIPFDSGTAWTRFLIERGVLPASAEQDYLAFCRDYVAGTLDIHAMHRASLLPLAAYPLEQLSVWGAAFEARMAPHIPPAMRALVLQHQRAGDWCAIVTATQRFIAEPFGRLFGIDVVLATGAATALVRQADGERQALTGEIDGEPCFREHKATHVGRWLATHGLALGDFEQSWFYSDSASDLPLLERVSHPVAVQPDERLLAHARALGWRVMLRDS
jgi:HAD superfamily hydrolase (TIGR01490 family)